MQVEYEERSWFQGNGSVLDVLNVRCLWDASTEMAIRELD